MRTLNIKAQKSIVKAAAFKNTQIYDLVIENNYLCRIEFVRDLTVHPEEVVEATFTMNPAGGFKALYTRYNYTYVHGSKEWDRGLFYVVDKDRSWEKWGGLTSKVIIEEFKEDYKIHGKEIHRYYYDMILTDQDEWCYAPTWIRNQLEEEQELQYYTKENEEIETYLLAIQ